MVVLHNPRWDGIYMVIVSEATEGVSKNGNPYVDLTLVIANAVDPEHIGYTVRFQKLYFTEKSMERSIHFLEVLTGTKLEKDRELDLDVAQLIDYRITVQFTQESYTGDAGKERQSTKIKKFWPEEAFEQIACKACAAQK